MIVFLPTWLAVQLGAGDAELIERLARRDAHAMADLYDRYGRLVYSLALGIVRDARIAEDLVEETFLCMWNRAPGLDARNSSMGPWLLAMACHRAIGYVRSAGGRERCSWQFDHTDRPELYLGMQKDILDSDKARRIKTAFGKLAPNLRQVIELACFEGLSPSEMAERMGQPPETVKTWARAALERLRDELRTAAPA